MVAEDKTAVVPIVDTDASSRIRRRLKLIERSTKQVGSQGDDVWCRPLPARVVNGQRRASDDDVSQRRRRRHRHRCTSTSDDDDEYNRDCDDGNTLNRAVLIDSEKAEAGESEAGEVDDDDDDDDDDGGDDENEDQFVRAKKAIHGRRRHIHPCTCDLSSVQRRRIKAHLDQRALMRRKYNRRIREIEEEFNRLEEERLERERELQEQEELFGDEYELIGKKRKRKKRSARRASMVSLGVKQVINWHKQPRITVRPTRASSLRKEHAAYCGHRPLASPTWRRIAYGDEPKVKVRTTRAFSLRMKINRKKRHFLDAEHRESKPRFQLPYYV